MQLVQISNAFAKCRYVENVGRVESPYQREVLTNTGEHWKVQMHRPYQFTSYKNLVFNEASEWVGNRWPLRAQLAQEQLLNSNLDDDFGRCTTSTTSVKLKYIESLTSLSYTLPATDSCLLKIKYKSILWTPGHLSHHGIFCQQKNPKNYIFQMEILNHGCNVIYTARVCQCCIVRCVWQDAVCCKMCAACGCFIEHCSRCSVQ